MPADIRSSSIGSAASGGVTVDRPSPILAHQDVLWAVQVTNSTLGDPPPGWSVVRSDTNDLVSVRQLRRTANGAEPATWTFGTSGVTIIACVRDSDLTISPRIAVDLTALAGTLGDQIATPTVAPAAPSHLEMRIAASWTNTLPSSPAATTKAPASYQMRRQTHLPAAQALAALATRQLNSSTGSGEKIFDVDPDDTGLSPIGITISFASADQEPTPDPVPPLLPGVGDALYVYEFRHVLTGELIDHFALRQVSFEHRINRGNISPGQFSAELPITSPDIARLAHQLVPRDPADLTRGPGVITCDVYRAGDPWGSFWINGSYVGQQRRQVPVLQLRGATLDDYLMCVEIQDDLDFEGEDQIEIARQLLEYMQSDPRSDIGLILQAGASGTLRDRHYKASEQAKVGQRLQELSEVINGFEWHILTKLGPAGLERHWRWAAPNLGDPDAAHYFSKSFEGGDILDWGIERTPKRGGNRWRARGDTPQTDASVEAVPLMSTVHEASAYLAAGHPRQDRTVDRPGVNQVETLEEYAASWAARSAVPSVFKATVLLGENPTISPASLGDHATFSMTNEWFYQVGSGPGYHERHRIIGMRITPVGRENGKDEAELIIEETEVVE
ncbi:hypothetical protein ACFFV7_50900 [Nonomuraea spiralis]|uniref:Uncharacterized protein n=1 Tax=Nonomuraea spiralis TaxID=46182 RepID=A0ABV5J093_9ACTN|nr:hypothetical protein [Nonomuraea spiralis]GGS88588.1 hypothetical protein GCM10010176_035460 [Nonomuraea spiralis]